MPQPRDIGECDQYLEELAGQGFYRCRAGHHVILHTMAIGQDQFTLVRHSVFNRLGDGVSEGREFAGPENIEEILADWPAEIFLEASVDGGNAQVGVHHDDLNRDRIEKLLVSLLGRADFFGQPLDLFAAGKNFKHENHFTVVVENRGRMYNYRHCGAAIIAHQGPRFHDILIPKGAGHRAVFAGGPLAAVNFPTVAVNAVSEIADVGGVGRQNRAVRAVDGYEIRQLVEVFHAAVNIVGDLADEGRHPIDDLADGEEPFSVHHLGGSFFRQRRQVVHRLLEPGLKGQEVFGPPQGHVQGDRSNRPQEKIGSRVFQPSHCQVQALRSAQNDNLHGRILGHDTIDQFLTTEHIEVHNGYGGVNVPEAAHAFQRTVGGNRLRVTFPNTG